MNLSDLDYSQLQSGLEAYLASLNVTGVIGRYYPCANNLTGDGKNLELGFSCFALKLSYMLGLWDRLSAHDQGQWVAYLKSFYKSDPGRFEDLSMTQFHTCQMSLKERIRKNLHMETYVDKVINAETKQALATLFMVRATHSPLSWPLRESPKQLIKYLKRLDWSKPWGAGGQSAALALFVSLEAKKVTSENELQFIKRGFMQFFTQQANVENGLYGAGLPKHEGHAINGAMKVLNALEWLGEKIHHPNRLIDTCLIYEPPTQGCYMVDVIYVLFRCIQEVDYRRDDICHYVRRLSEKIIESRMPDGGFAYDPKRTLIRYYEVPIADNCKQSDLRGTCLLVWALAMIFNILDIQILKWKVMKA